MLDCDDFDQYQAFSELRRPPFCVSVWEHDGPNDTNIFSGFSHLPLAATLRLLVEDYAAPQLCISVRYKGHQLAWIETDWCGRIKDAAIYRRCREDGLPYTTELCTPLLHLMDYNYANEILNPVRD